MPDQSTGVCAARTNALVCNIHELITELEERIEDGEPFDNPKLTRTAERVFGGSRAQGRYTPRDAYDAVEIAVNNHLLEKHAAELMQMDVTEALASVLRPLMQRLPRQSDRTLEQTELQQFSTPPTLAYLAARLLGPKPSDVVLEPSAGTGSLAIWPRAVGAKVICNETSLRRFSLLRCVLNFDPFPLDAEFIDDLLPAEIEPTVVLMNPPFSSTSGRVKSTNPIYGARHVASALRRLKDGGRLVAIVSEAMSFHHPSFSEWWQRIACLCNIRANLTLDGKEYAKYGAAPDVQILVIDKTGATPGATWQEQLQQISWGSAATLEEAWEALQHLVEPSHTPDDDPDESEPSGSLFVPYVPAKLKGGRPHPAVIVESASMAAVTPPDIIYRPHLTPEIVSAGRLSAIQLERVIYAGQRHGQRLPDGSRAGFFVGDGTGVGKGRVLAGIIADNWNQNRQRAIWLSVNNDLLESARRDLTDLGLESITLARINDYPPAGDITLPRGVIFSSYSSLIAAAKTGEKRLNQIQRWLGSDGVVIFDEAHKAKNALAGGRGEPTLTGQAVIDLQDPERNADYRVVYSSATGATDVRNMAYMTRLGLWGIYVLYNIILKMWRRQLCGVSSYSLSNGWVKRVSTPHKFSIVGGFFNPKWRFPTVFNLIYKDPETVGRHRAGPLADQRRRYLAYCAEQGATQGTLQGIAQAMLVVIEQLDLKAAGAIGADEIIAAAERWATRRPRHFNTRHARKARLHLISVATQWLRFLGRLRLCEAAPHPYAHLVDEFVDYMKRERGLSPRTLESQCWQINNFLRRLHDQHVSLNELSVAHIDEIISRKGSEDNYSRRSIRGYAESLRAFLRYAETRRWCDPGLAAGVKAPRVYQDESLPAGPGWEDVQHLIASAQNNRPTDIRDCAILMLLAVYGLRSAEVRCLKLEDLDWGKELICITRPKQLKTQTYPLSHTVGEAILRYLKEVRPCSPYREIFLTLQAPIQPLSRSGLWNVVGRRLQSLSPPLKHRGPHSLRHACASHLLAQGLSLKEIGDHLGHRSPNATRVYAKVDIAGLREVADFQLGGLL